MTFAASVLTLYPQMFPGPLGFSLAGNALDRGDWTLEVEQIRNFATDRHRSVDDTPAGGGAGMVLRADVLARAIDHVSPAGDPRPRLLMSHAASRSIKRRCVNWPGAMVSFWYAAALRALTKGSLTGAILRKSR